jgi:hypothetical protein
MRVIARTRNYWCRKPAGDDGTLPTTIVHLPLHCFASEMLYLCRVFSRLRVAKPRRAKPPPPHPFDGAGATTDTIARGGSVTPYACAGDLERASQICTSAARGEPTKGRGGARRTARKAVADFFTCEQFPRTSSNLLTAIS